MLYNPSAPADIVPVDVCINAIIVATWERGLADENKNVEFRNIVRSQIWNAIQVPNSILML